TIRWRDTDGGKKGREIIDAFLEKLADHLKPGGHCFLLQSSLNIPEMTEQKMKKLGMTGKIIATQKLFMEELQVWHLQI
ncbi:MAG: hypothetical protein U1C71_04005, partial [archaeon]|nr:hypothetical protein [archaeon]